MRINWPEFLANEFSNSELVYGRNGRELNIDCINEDCPNPKKHMYINLGSDDPEHDKMFVCHRCGLSGNHKAFLIAYYNLPYKEILKNFSDLYGAEESLLSSTQKDINRFSTKDLKIYLDYGDKKGFRIDLPKSFMPLTQLTKFCYRRDITMNIVRRFKLGKCKSGFYKNRIIFPITTNTNQSFLAYSQLTEKSLKKYKLLYKQNPDNKFYSDRSKKIRNPLGSLNSMLLYNYNNVKKNSPIIFIHEGALDVIRTTMHKFDAVGIFSKSISSYQAELISEKNPDEICLMLDSDAEGKFINRNLSVLADACECKLSLVKLEIGDPDNITTRSKFLRIIKDRQFAPFLNKAKPLKLL
jgi:DNA primase